MDALKILYENVSDVDLMAGIMSESFIRDTFVGPTLFCIMAKQLRLMRFADRFWFERGGQPHSLTLGKSLENAMRVIYWSINKNTYLLLINNLYFKNQFLQSSFNIELYREQWSSLPKWVQNL